MSGTQSLDAKCATVQLQVKTIKLFVKKTLVTIIEKQFVTSLIKQRRLLQIDNAFQSLTFI